MKVTFDSNTYRRVTDPSRFTKDANHAAFQKVRDAIVDRRIEPFLSETVASLEGIEKKHRGAFFAAAKAALMSRPRSCRAAKSQLRS